ncbi:MAG: HAD family phosphatase [Balneolales bacterium]
MQNRFGVIFDMDGVLVHSNPTHKKALKAFFEKHDKEITDEFLHNEVFGRTNKEWIPDVFGDLPVHTINEMANEKEKVFREIFNPVEAMVPGLKIFLNMLFDNEVKLAVATSAPVENADFVLSALSIRDYFDVILDSSHVKEGKPEPEIYLKAAEAIGFPAKKCIVFEDSLSGVESAIRAGAKVIGVTTTHTPEELSDCDKVIDNFHELSYQELASLF